jgi:serine/threonine protein kinase
VAGIDTPAGYSRLERMGTGAEADVYRAWDERASRWAVLKLFHRFVGGRSEEAAFATHIAASVGLGRNPVIVPVRAGGITATGRPWLALDLIEGRILAEVLRDDPPSPADALRLMITLADALAWAHSLRPPMVHGRIRAEHILVATSGVPMLTDFAVPRPNRVRTPVGDVTDLAALLFLAITGNPWPGRGDADDRIIGDWPGLTELFDEVLTPVPAIDAMAVFVDRLRRVRGPEGTVSTPPAVVVPEIKPMIPEMSYGPKRLLPLLGLMSLLPGRRGQRPPDR